MPKKTYNEKLHDSHDLTKVKFVGFDIVKKGKRYFVKDYLEYIFEL